MNEVRVSSSPRSAHSPPLTYLLPTRELELGSAQGFNHVLLVLGLGAHGHDDLANVHTGHGALRLPKSTTHPSLEPEVRRSGEQRGRRSDRCRKLR